MINKLYYLFIASADLASPYSREAVTRVYYPPFDFPARPAGIAQGDFQAECSRSLLGGSQSTWLWYTFNGS
jgi:hypothetical protein